MQNSYKGKILISTPDSNVDIFSKSVVLIVNHDVEGAFGLILNKKAKTVESNFIEILGNEMDIYVGGPVEHHRIFFMVRGEAFSDTHIKINDKLFVTEDFNGIILKVLKEELNLNDIKIFVGYSGWGPYQLESEIKQKYWKVVDEFPFDIFDNTTTLWKKMMFNLGGKYLLWANTPEDISLN